MSALLELEDASSARWTWDGGLYPAVVMEEEEEEDEPPDEDSGVMKMICHYSVCVS